ncbi:MAG: hypothetical protein K8S24_03835 [Candidatus Aegiribacteria sp.]|nr:hypothetical protein [Candidatus Aegiribacteria sp.]
MLNIISPSTVVLISLIILSFIGGCSGTEVDRTTWLIIVKEDTVSVGDVGEAWNRLGERQRELFSSKDNTIGEYIVTFSQKILLQHELEEAGYMSDSLLLSYSESWLTEKVGEASRRFLYEKELETVGDEEIDFFLSHVGRTVLYTVNPGSHDEETFGPVHLPVIPVDMIRILDTLNIGEVGFTESGTEVRLDSIVIADSSLIAQALADTVAVRSNAAAAIATRRFKEIEDSFKQSLQTDYSLSVDSAALEQFRLYYAEEAEFPAGETVIISSDLGNLTADELQSEILYYDSRFRIDPSDQVWLDGFIEFMVYNSYGRTILESESPGIIDSLQIESERYLLDLASEEFYTDRILSTVTVTMADMEDLFANLEEPFTIPEKRVLQAIIVSQDSMDTYLSLTPDEKDEFILRMPGFEYLVADSTLPQITRPLKVNEVPGFHGDEVFLIDPADTSSWLGPLELNTETHVCMFRLIEVIPTRNATFDEVEDELRTMTRSRLEEQATVEVIRELEVKFDLLINEDILEELPEDPSTWAEL